MADIEVTLLRDVKNGGEAGHPARAAGMMPESCGAKSGRWLVVRRRVRVVALAITTAAILYTSLVGAASAQAYDIDVPVVIDRALVATEHEDGFLAKSLPTISHEDFAPIGAPRLSSTLDPISIQREALAAATASADVTVFSERLSPFDNVQDVIRDCTKEALNKAAWDMWWSWAHDDSSFQPEGEAERGTVVVPPSLCGCHAREYAGRGRQSPDRLCRRRGWRSRPGAE